MGNLGDELLSNEAVIIERWYATWRASAHPHPSVDEAALKDQLPDQLRLIGEQLQKLATAESPGELWKVVERLDPEKRIGEDIPIEEVVREYELLIRVVRDWIQERNVQVSFEEYSYFYQAILELVGESVRRYAKHQADLIANARAEYLAGLMHQLRTPLSALLMQVELLARTGLAPDATVLARLQRNIGRIKCLVDNVLRLERFQPSEMPVHPEPVHPAHIIDELMSDLEQEAARKNLRFEDHVNRSLRMMVDTALFIDTLGNLLQNAIKYTHTGYVIVEAEERPEQVIFRVRDSGPGIDPDKLRNLFVLPQTSSEGGAGIGLQIAKHAAEAQGGSVKVKSELGKGSTFSFCLPRHVSTRAEA
jgi:signal transduction histidine kinase